MTKEVEKLLAEQFNKELYSAYLYLGIAAYYESKNLKGFAHWFVVQAQEERDHAMIFYRFITDNGVEFPFEALDKPKFSTADLKSPLTDTLAHEKFVTQSIYTIYDAAQKEKNYLVTQFLDWFVKEQGEEEKNAGDNIKNFELYGGDPKSLFMLDNQMGTRVYAQPSIMAGMVF
jgi:ferritin